MHTHYIINHDLSLRICIVSDLEEINLVKVIDEMIKVKLCEELPS
jgi:hypothetical protein